MSDPQDALAQIPLAMSTQVQCLFKGADRSRYIRFLNAMYHYTRHSGEELRRAAAISSSVRLRALFTQLAAEEQDHFRLAKADMRAMSAMPTATPPARVVELREWWQSVTPDRAHELLGAMYALESVGEHVATAAWSCLGRLELQRRQLRFVQAHLHADVEHGAMVRSVCESLTPVQWDQALTGARTAGQLWVQLHLDVIPSRRRAA